jgi:Fe-S oxidoreductase
VGSELCIRESPEVARAAVEVLESAGFRVQVPTAPICCGRPLYDYGMLDLADGMLRRMLRTLRRPIRDGVPVVGVEPSCLAVLRDELVGMRPHDEDAKRLSLQSLTLSEFLRRHAPQWRPPRIEGEAIVHGHCHQKATIGMEAEEEVLGDTGLEAEMLDAGCCGLAGSFGFEREHYEISVAIGERRLLPLVRQAPEETLLIADGFSCSTQVEQLAGRRPLHTAELLASGL